MQAKGIKNDNKSLHTKISVLGDDIIIGSANADVRSYFMDTNNAVMIRNAPNLVADYLAFLNRTQGPPQNSSTKFWDMDGAYMVTEQNEQIIFPYASITPELMHKQNEVIVLQMQKYWDAEEKHLDATKRGQLQITITDLGKKIQDATDAILKSDSSMNNDKLEEIANTFDDTWKAL
ncbi:MAG: phosphatidylserine/phosphatidylglycerophosphate/cardiolipin synthase family protein [Bdellovibrionales bacterium]|nr:phosphatidylserine/phosphatidylglycerophosphate/cardiolipin synthase family protein [Bdellovibrionales bacterium]